MKAGRELHVVPMFLLGDVDFSNQRLYICHCIFYISMLVEAQTKGQNAL